MSIRPASPFFSTRLQVVELARRRYFEDGVPPAGAISDAVFQSWARCQRLHDDPHGRVEFQPVTASRTQLALQRNRSLHEAWLAELPHLQMLLGTTSCAAMLTDGSGVLIGATCTGRPHESLMPVATRVGVDLSEEAVGTTAPGVVVRTGQPVCVLGSEHFFEGVRQMHCAAVPIRDTRGCVAGVLDISSEAIAFGFDATSVVGHFASAIENRLLVAQARAQLILRLQIAPALLDSAAVGLVGIDMDGRIAWLNGMACRLLGMPALDYERELPLAESVLGSSFSRLASLPRHGAGVVPLANGLALWARSEIQGGEARTDHVQVPLHGMPDGVVDAPVPGPAFDVSQPPLPSATQEAAIPPPLRTEAAAVGLPEDCPGPTVKGIHHDLLHRTLLACGGNLSEAARRLGVSRGWVYRRMREAGDHSRH